MDFFVNDDPRFALWSERIVQALSDQGLWRTEISLREEPFIRLNLVREEDSLEIELVDDVPAHVGKIRQDSTGRLDSAENILANKLTALLARGEPKDLADTWGFCCAMKLPIEEAGLFPADLARVLLSANQGDWELIR